MSAQFRDYLFVWAFTVEWMFVIRAALELAARPGPGGGDRQQLIDRGSSHG